MTTEMLPERAEALRGVLMLLTAPPGYFELETPEEARGFYMMWRELCVEVIAAGCDGSIGSVSYAKLQLDRLLSRTPWQQTRIGVLEVFPTRAWTSLFAFNQFMACLDRVAAQQATLQS